MAHLGFRIYVGLLLNFGPPRMAIPASRRMTHGRIAERIACPASTRTAPESLIPGFRASILSRLGDPLLGGPLALITLPQ